MTTTFECIVSGDLMRRAWKCVSTEGFCYYPQGVFVHVHPEGGAAIVSTDGHMMLVLHDKTGIVSGSGIVKMTPETLKACKKAGAFVVVGSGKLSVVCAKEASEVSVSVAATPNESVIAHQWAGVLMNDDFPDYRKVVPSEHGSYFGTINPKLIARVGEALSDTSGNGITICGAIEAGSAHVVLPNSVVPGFGLIMGMRGKGPEWKRPGWLSPDPELQAAE